MATLHALLCHVSITQRYSALLSITQHESAWHGALQMRRGSMLISTSQCINATKSLQIPKSSGQQGPVFLQGASPADVKEQLVASATYDMIQDDPAGGASLEGIGSGMLDISPTPNRLLYSMLNKQRPSET